MKNISKYITYNEAINSQKANILKIANVPNNAQLLAMQLVGIRIFDVVRDHFKSPLKVSSFFRNEAVNRAVKGSKTSQHVKGQAIDIQGLGAVTNKQIFEFIKDNLDFDQLINEYDYSWVHVSYVSKEKNRNQIISIK